jgi:CheY-like chemotaxis protein
LPSEEEASSGQSSGPDPRGLRVLVVDDNVDYAEGVAMLLQSSGYLVKVVHTGPEALQAMAGFRPDTVVLDIGLPGMDGYEVARRIREEPMFENLRIVGVSGYRQEAEGSRSGQARFDSYLLKPVLLERLEASLRPESGG